jgi:cob(I)alamin adenosyltransferase
MPVTDGGFVQVYTGDGKGKTTAALGLALRAALSGMRVFIGQFMKGTSYAELGIARIPFGDLSGGRVDLEQYGTPRLICQGEAPSRDDVASARLGLEDLRRRMTGGGYDVVIADEINVALHFDLLQVDDVLELLLARPEGVELVLTGRQAPPEIIERADLVTDMREIKHYYALQGVQARKGIEY